MEGNGSDDMRTNEWIVQRIVVDDAVIDTRDPYAVIDPVWWTGNIYGSVADYEASLRTFTREQRLIYAAMWYLSEVNNGGHDQFFFNSTGIVWPDAREAFPRMDLPEVAEILDESAERLGDSPSRDRDERGLQLESSKADFRDLDDRLYDLESELDIDARLADFIQAHRQQFYFDGSVSKPRL